MTTYVSIPDTDIDQDSPITQVLLTALRDNPIAITEGASGAPQIQTTAIAPAAVTVSRLATGGGEDTWVRQRMAGHDAGEVGTYAFAATSNSTSSTSFGSTIAGSSLVPIGFREDGGYGEDGISLSGTWRAMGRKPARTTNNSNNREATLWLRIS